MAGRLIKLGFYAVLAISMGSMVGCSGATYEKNLSSAPPVQEQSGKLSAATTTTFNNGTTIISLKTVKERGAGSLWAVVVRGVNQESRVVSCSHKYGNTTETLPIEACAGAETLAP